MTQENYLDDLLGKVRRIGESDEACLARLIDTEYKAIRGDAASVWLTPKEAAAYIGLNVRTLNLKALRGEITHYKPGKERRFLKSDLDDYIRQHRHPASHALADGAAQSMEKTPTHVDEMR